MLDGSGVLDLTPTGGTSGALTVAVGDTIEGIINFPMQYIRLFADLTGESHFQDVDVVLARIAQYARGVPQACISAPRSSTSVTFLSGPPGWVGDWHPAPRRQFMIKLAGETEIVASDGEKRQIRPGIALLLEDTSGKGHYSRVLGPGDDVWFVASLADDDSNQSRST
jgi:hypothetical protein